jgi:hypothetical protein
MSTIAVNAITDANDGNTTTINGVTPNSANVVGKNKIINGNMLIDQRNAGASVTPTNGNYTLDRWIAYLSQTSKITIEQNAGSVTPPTGFTNYLGVTSSSAYSVAAGDYFLIGQHIEGYNVADLDFGKSTAKTITVSFYVRSSLTGTFGGVLGNAGSRSYPFTYTISSANTWEQKTITIPGDTAGTWTTANSYGLTLYIGLGAGSTYSGTAGAWSSNSYFNATGATSVVGTSGATFYITGVQLEVGESATEFEHRPYTTELQLCQRYYQQPIDSGLDFFAGYFVNGYYGPGCFSTWYCEMRATPTVVVTLGSLNVVGSVSVNYFDKKRFHLNPTANGTGSGFWYLAKLTADAEL